MGNHAKGAGQGKDKPWGGTYISDAGFPADHKLDPELRRKLLREAEDAFAIKRAQMLRPHPMENVIVGAENVLRYMGIGSATTLKRWVDLYGFPAVKRPDGLWMTTMTAVDQWIFLCAELENERRTLGRGYNLPPMATMDRLERSIRDGTFGKQRYEAAERAARGVGALPGRTEPRHPYKSSHKERAQRGKAESHQPGTDKRSVPVDSLGRQLPDANERSETWPGEMGPDMMKQRAEGE